MKAPDFDYACPKTLEDALLLLATGDREAMPLAGGQSLIAMMNFRLASPELLVDLNGIAGLSGLVDEGDCISIGAMTSYADLEASDLAAAHLPLIKQAIPFIAHAAIRHRGTIGGSIALADPAAEMPALLLALDAAITVSSLGGKRILKVDDFFQGLYETALQPGELITSVSITKAAGARPFAFRELARRHGDYAMAGLAVTAQACQPFADLRLAFFGVCNCAVRAKATENALNGQSLGDEKALNSAIEAIESLPFNGDLNASVATKRHLATVLFQRTLCELSS